MRKNTSIPYISHPFAVAVLLLQQQCDEHVIVAGLLHDTVEDTSVTINDIRREFGAKVAEIVAGVTEPDKSLSWEERKCHMIESIRTASQEIKFVSCADKLHNVLTVRQTFDEIGDRVWERFSRGYDGQKWYSRSMVASLFHNLEKKHQKPMFFELKRMVEDFFQDE